MDVAFDKSLNGFTLMYCSGGNYWEEEAEKSFLAGIYSITLAKNSPPKKPLYK